MSDSLALTQLIAKIDQHVRPVVLIDGRAGSGKSTLSEQLAPRLGAQLVHLDDIYPGWGGLAEASDHVHRFVLAPERPRWQAWDWSAEQPGEWHNLDADQPIVIEGVGALSRANRALATFAVWLELDAATRKQRALDRDGELFAAHWDEWAALEERFLAREHPRDLADLVLA